MKRLLFFFAVVVLFCSCKREEASKVVILVTTNDSLTNVKSRDSVLFHIHSFANEDVVKNLTIISSDIQYGSVVLLDTLLNMQSFDFDYYYVLPNYKDTTQIELSFNVFSSNNLSQSSYNTFVKICPEADTTGGQEPPVEPPIPEDTALVLYSHLVFYGSAWYIERAFNLEYLSNMLDTLLIDSTMMDIVDILGDDSTGLSGNWTSYTGVLFARFNDLNFDIATKKDIVTAYNAAIKHTTIQNIQPNEIILIGRQNTAIGVIKIITIDNMAERYVFDLKMVE